VLLGFRVLAELGVEQIDVKENRFLGSIVINTGHIKLALTRR